MLEKFSKRLARNAFLGLAAPLLFNISLNSITNGKIFDLS